MSDDHLHDQNINDIRDINGIDISIEKPNLWKEFEFKEKTILDGTNYILLGPNMGKLIIFVHGVAGGIFQFKHLAVDLVEKGYRVLLYDQLGRGFSKNHKSGKFGAEEHLDQLRSLITALQIKEPLNLLVIIDISYNY